MMNTPNSRGGRAATTAAFAVVLSVAFAAPAIAGDRGKSRVEQVHERAAQARQDREEAKGEDPRQDRSDAAERRKRAAAEHARLQREAAERGRDQRERSLEGRREGHATRPDHSSRDEARRRAEPLQRRDRTQPQRPRIDAPAPRLVASTDPRSGVGNVGSDEHRRRQYELHRERERDYRGYHERRDHFARERAHELQRQRRMQQYRYQQLYHQRLLEQQRRWAASHYDYARDPFYSTPFGYRYQVGGRTWQTNRYGVDLMRQAAQHGYAEGIRAGQADRYDGWRADYRGSWAYQDASYGYPGRYIDRGHYAHYFREGFRRGYEDGYHGRSRYGRNDNGQHMLVAAILSAILGIQSI